MYGCILLSRPPASATVHTDLRGTRLYKPSVIVTYGLFLGLPFGLALYGLNVFRLGSRGVGILLGVVGSLIFILAAGIRMSGGPSHLFGLGGVFALLPLFQLASWPYSDAVQRGAEPARSWPPLIAALVGAAVIAILGVVVQAPAGI